MSRKKLTLSVQERLTKRAKKIAEKRGTSVSRLVETFFTALEEEEKQHDPEQPAEGPLSESDEEEFSEWARRWRGAFAEEGETYPDDPSWEEDRLREEIEKKHAPQ
ncbi:MAG: DUF6364 family protein [Salinivenus sp.]